MAIDTKSLIELFITKNKNVLLKDIENNKKVIWNTYFKLDNPIFKQNNYIFDYVITTDCFSVSIKMLNKNNVEEENKKKLNMKNKKNKNKEKTKNMTQEQKEKFKKEEKLKQKSKDEEYKLKLKGKKDKEKEEFKKLPKEEQKEEIKKKKIKNKEECKYIDDLNDKELKELDKNNWVVNDIGVRIPIYMKNKNGVRFRYSNRKHANRTKRFKYHKIIKKHKDNDNISKTENELSKYNSKTINFKKFKEYITNKNRINNILFDKYNNEIFRKYKWYGFLNRKKADAKLVRELKHIFGKESIMILGDASISNGACKKGNISTPTKRFNNLMRDNFKTYNIDEFRTSKLHYKTEEECENIYLLDNNKDKTKRMKRKIHAVLTGTTQSVVSLRSVVLHTTFLIINNKQFNYLFYYIFFYSLLSIMVVNLNNENIHIILLYFQN